MMDARLFQVLGDPTRLCIVELLRKGALPVNDIVARTNVQQSGVSRHLRILEGAGVVSVEPRGQQRIYALREAPFRELETWASAVRRTWEGRLDALGEALARKKAARARGETKTDTKKERT